MKLEELLIKGFEIAMKRRKKVISVDKANVLGFFKTCGDKIVNEVAKGLS